MFLLDTNVVSELRKVAEGKADANVAAWQASVDELACFLSVITVQELEMGVLRIERRDPVQGRRLREWLEQRVIPAFAGRILPIDQATALVHGLTVVTRNTGDFAPLGVDMLDPWQAVRSGG